MINSKVIHWSFLGAFWGNKVINVLDILKPSKYCKPNKHLHLPFILSS